MRQRELKEPEAQVVEPSDAQVESSNVSNQETVHVESLAGDEVVEEVSNAESPEPSVLEAETVDTEVQSDQSKVRIFYIVFQIFPPYGKFVNSLLPLDEWFPRYFFSFILFYPYLNQWCLNRMRQNR